MKPEKKALASAKAKAQKQELLFSDLYYNPSNDASQSSKSQEQIEKRRKTIPPSHRASYDKAVRGRSLKAGIIACCQECCGHQRSEIQNCSDPACSLYPYRPYQNILQNGLEDRVTAPESQNSGQEVSKAISAQIEQKLAKITAVYRKTYREAMEGKSRRSAVNAFCLECFGWQRNEVGSCPSLACPLFAYRPYKK